MFTRGPSKTFGGLDDAIRRSMPGRSTTVASPREEEEERDSGVRIGIHFSSVFDKREGDAEIDVRLFVPHPSATEPISRVSPFPSFVSTAAC